MREGGGPGRDEELTEYNLTHRRRCVVFDTVGRSFPVGGGSECDCDMKHSLRHFFSAVSSTGFGSDLAGDLRTGKRFE
jgi:hypothetical protein